MNWPLEVLKKYGVFRGRARRKEYWFYALFILLVSLSIYLLDRLIGTVDPDTRVGLLGSIFSLATLVPTLAVSARRLHDTGRSGWWLLIGLIPGVGAIVLLIFMVKDGDAETNPYGPNPKEAAA